MNLSANIDNLYLIFNFKLGKLGYVNQIVYNESRNKKVITLTIENSGEVSRKTIDTFSKSKT